MKRAVVFPDQHYPIHDVKAVNVALQVLEKANPDIFINLGDVGEFESVSSHKYKRRKRPPLEFQLPLIDKDIADVNKELDRVDAVLDKVGCKERYICQGNHDEWLDRFVMENPYLTDYTFKKAIKLDERGYKYYPAGKYLKIGRMNFYHGHHFAGINHTRNHLLRLGANVMYGHHHDLQQSSVTHLDGVKSAWSIGCLKDMTSEQNRWLGGRQHNWSHAFAVVDYFDKGLFTVHVINIIEGRTSLWGKLIEG